MSKSFIRNHIARIASAVLAAAFAVAALPAVASAQAGEQIQGTVQSINGTWNITVLDQNGYLDNVGLHQGTIINPTGLTLAPGMSVTILGYTEGNVFEANEIDTPYQYSGPLPVPVYYGPGWWYPGFAYGYGPSFSLALSFGGGGFFVARQAWAGHWWAPTPIHGFVAFRAPAGNPSYAGPRPGYARPALGSYARPSYQNYARPAPAQAYRAPAARVEGGAQFSGGARPSYSGAARPSYSGAARPSYSGAARPSYGGAARPNYSGARASAASHSSGGARASAGHDRGDRR